MSAPEGGGGSEKRPHVAISGLRQLPGLSVALFDEGCRYLVVGGQAVTDARLDPDEIEGRSAADVLGPERWEFWKPYYEAALTGHASSVDVRALDGGRWYQVDVAPRYDGAGEIVGGMAVGREITSRRLSEERVAFLTALIEQSDDAIIGNDLDGVITSWNRGAERIYGYTAQEAVGRHISLLSVPGQGLDVAEITERTRHGEVVREQALRRTKEGRDVTVALTVSQVHDADGQIAGASTIARDLSAPKRIADELRIGQERWRAIFDTGRLGIAIRDADGRLVECNRVYSEIFESTPEALVGSDFSAILPTSEAARSMKRFTERWSQTSDQLGHDQVFSTRSGRRLHLISSVSPVFDASGARAFQVIAVQDRTDQRMLEDQLAQAQRLEAIARLAGAVAHQLNNKLSVILGVSDIIATARPGDDRLREDLEVIRASADQCTAMTRDLLSIGHRQTFEPVAINLSELVTEIEDRIRSGLGDRIALTVTDDCAGAVIRGDRAGLVHALENLARNGCEAMPDGGSLTIRAIRAHAPTRDGGQDRVAISVGDTGVGMTADVIERSFEPFFTTKDFGNGAGLGLALARSIVEQSGGSIAIESSPGLGTTVRVEFELAGDRATGAADEPFEPSRPAPEVVDSSPRA